MRSRQIPILVILFILTLAAIGGLYYVNSRVASSDLAGRDFRLNWSGARYFLLQKVNPYQPELAAQIRREVFGIPLGAEGYPHRLEYPFYILFIYFPFAAIPDLKIALALWLLVLQACMLGGLFFYLRVLDWRPNPLLFFLLLVLALFWQPALLAFLDGNASILLVFLFAAVLLCLRQGADEAAGLLMVLCTFKWEAGGLLLLLIMLWAASHGRWQVLSMFGIGLSVMLALVTILLPAWPLPYFQSVFANLSAGKGVSTFQVFMNWWPGLGDKLAWGLILALGVILLLEWRFARRRELPHLAWTAALTLAATPLLGLPVEPANLSLLLLPVLIIVSVTGARWKRHSAWLLPLLVLSLLALPWVNAFLSVSEKQAAYRLSILLPLGLVLALYWLKWWVVRPPRVWADRLRAGN